MSAKDSLLRVTQMRCGHWVGLAFLVLSLRSSEEVELFYVFQKVTLDQGMEGVRI
jgi:hypothetical protein